MLIIALWITLYCCIMIIANAYVRFQTEKEIKQHTAGPLSNKNKEDITLTGILFGIFWPVYFIFLIIKWTLYSIPKKLADSFRSKKLEEGNKFQGPYR